MAFCPACGATIPPSVSFCPRCGRSLFDVAATAPIVGSDQPIKRTSRLKRNLALLLLVIAIAIAVAAIIFGGALFPAHHSVVVASGYAVIPEGYYRNSTFTVPAGATDAVISGSFTVSGDFGNQMTVMIMSASQFQSWQLGGQVVPYYNSGQVSGASVGVSLPAAGDYVIVFYNDFTGAASTVITGQLTLTYTGG